MKFSVQAIQLRIYLGEDQKFQGKPLYECIVLKARELGLAGATVLRGPLGYGHNSQLRSTKVLRLSEDLPLVIDIIDEEDKINDFLPTLDNMMNSGLVTLGKVDIRQYGQSTQS